MKHLLTLILFGITISLFSCQSKESSDEANELNKHLPTDLISNPRSIEDDTMALNQLGKLVFSDTIHDFGKIVDGENVEFDFEFENVGKKDVLISEAKASCGCTVPVYPQQPIKSGEKNKIKVTFDSHGRTGMNEKLIIVNTNGNPSVYNLYIQAEVSDK